MKFQIKRVEFFSKEASYRLFEEGELCDSLTEALEKWKRLVTYHQVILPENPAEARREKQETVVRFKDPPGEFFMCVGFVIEPVIDDGKKRAYKSIFPIP